MKCIFCRSSSEDSRSKEHIIPESLGNIDHILPKGVVCDQCNNYFARKVEKPVLDHSYFKAIRSELAVFSKKKRLPMVPTLFPKQGVATSAALYPTSTKGIWGLVCSDDVATQAIFSDTKSTKGVMYMLASSPNGPPDGIMDRMLAKMALEALACRFISHWGNTKSYEDDIFSSQLDELRDFARKGMKPSSWPYHQRKLYSMTEELFDDKGAPYQVMHEFDFLITDQQEWYFVIVIFGIEYAINIGGPELDGYVDWLNKNDHQSTLYMGKNAHS